MAIPRFMRPVVRHVVNPVSKLFAGRAPGFAILTHVGRTSGRSYSTPINVFHRDGEYIFALTYGDDTQWVRNVIASGSAELQERGRRVRLGQPRLFTDPKGRSVPLPVALFLRMTGVSGYLAMRPAEGP